MQSRLLIRRRLSALVDAVPAPRLVLISAAAGFGKTTCARQLAADFAGCVSWLALDPEDDDALRFFSYFLAGLRRAVGELSERTVKALESSSAPSIRSAVTLLINELSELDVPVCAVVDDFHLISSESVHRELEFLITHAPAGFRLVLATRNDPQFNLSRLRARGEIVEIGSRELRLTPEETAAFLSNRSTLNLDESHLRLIEERTEGWIAGVQMAALSMTGREGPGTFFRSFGGRHRHIVDYLTAEVLAAQPDAVQRFLIRSSILSRLSGGLCDALCTVPELPGQETLEYLERANLFVTALDERRRWFRLHPLLRELLRDRLEGDARVLHRRAATWLISEGLYDDALLHAVHGEDGLLLEKAVDGGGTPLYARGATASVLAALEAVPAGTCDGEPMLWVHRAWATWTAYRSDDVPYLLDAAERALTPRGGNARVAAHLFALKANLAANHNEADTVAECASRAITALTEDDAYARSAAYRARAFACQLRNDRRDAIRDYRRAIALCEASGIAHLQIIAVTGLGLVYEADLFLEDAETCYREVLRLSGDPEQPVTCEAHAGLGRIAYARNDLQEAEARLSHGRTLARKIQGIDSHVSAAIELCRVHQAAGNRAKLQRTLAEVRRELRSEGYDRQRGALRLFEARAALAAGDTGVAAELLDDDHVRSVPGAAPFARARLRIARGEYVECLRDLDDIRTAAETREPRDVALTARILESIARAAIGENGVAREILAEVWAELKPQGAVRPILDEGDTARALLRAIDPDLAVFSGSDVGGGKSGVEELNPPSLSRREREVLRLVAEGLSNEEIAGRLFVSLSTIKGHNSRIFEKLGVRRRTEAVAEARRLRLL